MAISKTIKDTYQEKGRKNKSQLINMSKVKVMEERKQGNNLLCLDINVLRVKKKKSCASMSTDYLVI